MERRVEQRLEMNLHLGCRVPATPCHGVLLDISADGCRVKVPTTNIEPGSTALLDLPGAPRWPGRVVWIRNGEVGVRFQRRLRGAPAVTLGIETPAPAQPESPPAPVAAGGGLLRHWIRRLAGLSA